MSSGCLCVEACGICLELLNASSCPLAASIDRLPSCDSVRDHGSLCEGDGECDTLRTANNCNGNQDVYRVCSTRLAAPPLLPPSEPAEPPKPPQLPPPPRQPSKPLPTCSSLCTAGKACGMCLNPYNATCPDAVAVDALPRCIAGLVLPGGLCEGDGECGTSQLANSCNGWQDVYKREDCSPEVRMRRISGLLGAVLACSGIAIIFCTFAFYWMRRLVRRSAASHTTGLACITCTKSVASTSANSELAVAMNAL